MDGGVHIEADTIACYKSHDTRHDFCPGHYPSHCPGWSQWRLEHFMGVEVVSTLSVGWDCDWDSR